MSTLRVTSLVGHPEDIRGLMAEQTWYERSHGTDRRRNFPPCTKPYDIVLMNTFLVPGEGKQVGPKEKEVDLVPPHSFATSGRRLPILVSATTLPSPTRECYQQISLSKAFWHLQIPCIVWAITLLAIFIWYCGHACHTLLAGRALPNLLDSVIDATSPQFLQADSYNLILFFPSIHLYLSGASGLYAKLKKKTLKRSGKVIMR